MGKLHFTTARILAVGLVMAATLTTAGCSNGTGSGKTTVTFLNWEQTEGMPLGNAIKQFEKENPNITVDVQPTVVGAGYDVKMRTALAGNNPPDVFRINDDYVQQFTKNGTLFDLAPYVKKAGLKLDDYAPQVFNFGKQSDGRLTSWQIGYQPAVVFYNKNLFEKAGVPLPPKTWSSKGWTWDDFRNYAKKLTDGTSTYGAIVTPDTNFEQTFAHNNGSKTGIWSADGKSFTLGDAKGAEAIQWAADLTCVDKVQPRWADLLQPNTNVQMFAQGKAAMLFARAGSVPYFRENIKSFDWDIAAPPAKVEQATEASVVAFGVPTKAKNHDAAFKLLNFLASKEGGQIVGKGGAFTPVNVAAAKALYSDPKASPASIDLLGESSQHLTATSKTANTLGARQIYRPALDAVYNCSASARSVFTKVKPQIDKALSEG